MWGSWDGVRSNANANAVASVLPCIRSWPMPVYGCREDARMLIEELEVGVGEREVWTSGQAASFYLDAARADDASCITLESALVWS